MFNDKDTRYRRAVLKDYINKDISRRVAAIKLNLNESYISTLKRRYLAEGDECLTHGNSGRISEKRTSKEIETRIVNLYREKYEPVDASFSHFYDLITEDSNELMEITNGKMLAFRTICNILARYNVRSPYTHRIKSKTSHPSRRRRDTFGELIQIDASVHDWLGNGKKHNLVLAVDDATSKIVGAVFSVQETKEAYLELAKQIFMNYGVPRKLYGDNRSVHCTTGKHLKILNNTQFRGAMRRFGVEIITTSKSQAKGRVERNFRYLQDRLITELRLKNIDNYDDAANYLALFVLKRNKKHSVTAYSNESSFRPLSKYEFENINLLLASHYAKKILDGNTISHKSIRWQPVDIDGKPLIISQGEDVQLVEMFGDINDKNSANYMIKYDEKFFKVLPVREHLGAIIPSKNHPWRRFSYGNAVKKK